jgi:hypothetical protein
MSNNSRQTQDLRYLYETIYSESLVEDENDLLMIEWYNSLVEEGLINGDLIENGILSEGVWDKAGAALSKYGPRAFNAAKTVFKQVTGVGTKPTTKLGTSVRGGQQLTTGAVTASPDARERISGAAKGAVQGAMNPKKSQFADSFDSYDVIKGHLLDEGYADTEEAALKIMANMSEEWRQSIIEGLVGTIAKAVPKAVPAVVSAVKNAPKAVNNTIRYYEKNPEQALPFLAPALAASGNRARQERDQKK